MVAGYDKRGPQIFVVNSEGDRTQLKMCSVSIHLQYTFQLPWFFSRSVLRLSQSFVDRTWKLPWKPFQWQRRLVQMTFETYFSLVSIINWLVKSKKKLVKSYLLAFYFRISTTVCCFIWSNRASCLTSKFDSMRLRIDISFLTDYLFIKNGKPFGMRQT